MATTDEYVLTRRTVSISREGRTLYRFRWTRVSDGQEFETTVDDSTRNWRTQGWPALAQDTQPWGVYRGLREINRQTRRGYGVITADSQPQRFETLTERQARDLADACRSGATTTQFNSLFSDANRTTTSSLEDRA